MVSDQLGPHLLLPPPARVRSSRLLSVHLPGNSHRWWLLLHENEVFQSAGTGPPTGEVSQVAVKIYVP